MDFLDKLYASNYFGIGLFTVISFLVVTFLVVLFFGKRDEKKRKLEETDRISIGSLKDDTFKETSEATPIEMPVMPTPVKEEPTIFEPVTPINFDSIPLEEPVYDSVIEPIKENTNDYVDNLVIEEAKDNSEVNTNNDFNNVVLEPITFELPVEPKVEEPTIFGEETYNIEPLIKEEVKPIIVPSVEMASPIIEEPVISETYYNPVEKVEAEEIKVPNIDFDEIVKSISKELDELENSSVNNEEVTITPINEVTKPSNQFSSVYVNEPIKVNEPVKTSLRPSIDLPKKIDLPTMKEEIEPESYSL